MRRSNRLKLAATVVAAGLIATAVGVTVANAAGGPNLSLGKATSASSTNGGFVTGNLNDGNQNSYWESTNNSFPQWAQVDLGVSTSIDQVILKLPSAWGTRTQTLSIQGSSDNVSFATIVSSAGRVFTQGSNAVTINFTATSTRYVRVNITANTGWAAAQLSELEVYGTSTSSPNLALGKAMSESGHAQNYVAANANDANQGTYWESVNNAFPQHLQVDLASSVSVNRVVLKTPTSGWGARTQTLSVQGSTNGTTFTDIVPSAAYNFQPASANTVTINFGQTTQRYIRIRITANTAWPAGQISELEVYGPGGPADTTPPSVPGTLSFTQSGSTINLSWGASSDTGGSGLAGYDIYRNGTLAASTNATTTTYADTTQPTTATVSYFVRARDNAGNVSGNSNTVTRTGTNPDTTPPTVPGTLSFTQSGSTINLSWGASTDTGGSGLAGYDVFRNGALIATTNATTTTYADTTQPTTATVSYFVRARDGAGNLSGNSNTVTRTGTNPDTTPPTVPGTLSFTQSGSTINLSWGASTDTGGSGLAGYDVFRNGSIAGSTNATTTTFSDNTQPTSVTVSYFVRARDGAGNLSGNSNTVTRQGTTNETNVALNKSVTATGSTFTFVPANATDGNVATYWEGSPTYPQDITVALGANHAISRVVVKLNPDPAWGTRTQNFQILGRDQASSTYTNLVSAANYQFVQGNNVVTIPVTASTADVRLRFNSNTGAPSGQVAELEVWGVAAPNPDLTVTAVSWTPTSPNETSAITLSATVRNAGTATAGATTVNFNLGGAVVGNAAVGSLAASATATVTLAVGQRPMGNYSVSATVDPTNTIIEQSDSNNTFTAASPLVVAQAPGPDLQVLSISANPPNPAAGANVSFSVAVNNRGTTASGVTSVTRVTVGTTTLNGNTASVAAGATVNVAISGTWTATAGGANITATADATNVVAETNETNNAFSQAIVVGRGASVPYTSYEAESGTHNGTLVVADPLRTFGHTNFGTESSGRQSVRLNSTGQFVQFTSTNATNSIVVRNSVPDSAGGGGQDYTISLYINGTFAQKLTLSSRNSWLYGTTDDTESLSNTPSADARRLFDESHALLAQSWPAGTTFRLQRDSGDNASFYIIDLIDLEQVAAPLSQPAGCTSITSYGAVANDGLDDTAAIQRAVTDDENGVISCVWIPAGQWRQEQKILSPDPTRGQFNQRGIRNVVVRGAGMWHTQLYTNTQPQNVVGNINHPHEGNVGFDIDENTQISDLAIFGNTQNRANRGHGINGRLGNNTRISNVWIEHVNVGAWVGRDFSDTPAYWNPGNNLEFTGMRIRDTYADGINFSNGTRNSRVFNSSFRTNGDDALAVWANPRVRDTAVDVGQQQPLRQQHHPVAVAGQRRRDLRRLRQLHREQPHLRHDELPGHHAGDRPRPAAVLGHDVDRQQRALPDRWRLLERGPGVRRHHPVRPGPGHRGSHDPGHGHLRLHLRRHPVQDGRRQHAQRRDHQRTDR